MMQGGTSGSTSSSSQSSLKPTPTSYASVRTEAILSLLMFCDRGGKQLIAAYPSLGARKGGSGPDLREGVLRAVRETSSDELRRALMEVEARLCMADQVCGARSFVRLFIHVFIHLLCDPRTLLRLLRRRLLLTGFASAENMLACWDYSAPTSQCHTKFRIPKTCSHSPQSLPRFLLPCLVTTTTAHVCTNSSPTTTPPHGNSLHTPPSPPLPLESAARMWMLMRT